MIRSSFSTCSTRLKSSASTLATAAGFIVVTSGCSPTYGSLAPSRLFVQQAEQGQPPPEGAETCELRLYMEYTKERAIGYAAVETDGDHQLTDGLCIKKPGQPLQMPERIMIAARKLGRLRLRLRGHARGERTPGHRGVRLEPQVPEYLPDDLHFRRRRKGTKVADYLALARVYHNGRPIARYNAASQLQNPQVLVFRAEELHVSDSPFSPRPPHLAQMDLRVVPAG